MEVSKQSSQNRVELSKPDFPQKALEKATGEHRTQVFTIWTLLVVFITVTFLKLNGTSTTAQS